ncbi:MAG: hypothetical protein WHX60_14665 [Armatimonadota bacterium]
MNGFVRYIIPHHPDGQWVILFICLFTLYVLGWWLLLSGQVLSDLRQKYQDLLRSINDTEQADWHATTERLRAQALAKLGHVRSAPNILLLLGLLGTVLGLAQTVGSLAYTLEGAFQESIRQSDPQAIFELLQGTLQSMGTAFSCTLWGIASALIVIFSNRYFMGKLLADVSKEEIELIGNIRRRRSKTVQLLEQTTSDLLELKKLNSQAVHFLAGIHSELSKLGSFIDKFDHLVAKMQEIVDSVPQVVDLLQKTSVEMITELKRSVDSLTKTLDAVTKSLQEAVDQLNATVSSVKEILNQLAKDVRSVLNESSEQLRKSAADLASYHTQLSEEHQKLHERHEELLGVFQDARNDLERLIAEQLEKIGQYDETFRRNSDEIVFRVQTFIDEAQRLSNTINEQSKDLLAQLRAIESAINTAFGGLKEQHRDLFAEHKHLVQGSLAEVKSYIEHLLDLHEQSIGEVHRAIERVAKQLNEISAWLEQIEDSPVWKIHLDISRNGDWSKLPEVLQATKDHIQNINNDLAVLAQVGRKEWLDNMQTLQKSLQEIENILRTSGNGKRRGILQRQVAVIQDIGSQKKALPQSEIKDIADMKPAQPSADNAEDPGNDEKPH